MILPRILAKLRRYARCKGGIMMDENAFSVLPDVDRRVIENKYHKTDEPFDGFNRMAYHGYDFDPSTGKTDSEIDAGLASLAKALEGKSHSIIKARLFEYVLDNTMIDVNESDYFVGIYSWGRLIDKYTVNPWLREATLKAKAEVNNDKKGEFFATGTAWIALDFDHTVPDFDSLAALGFAGLLDRLESSYARLKAEGELSESQEIFYRAVKIEYEAILRLVGRLAELAESKNFDKAPLVAASLRTLQKGAPETTLDMLQLMYVYFMLSESVEHYQVRSLGHGLDETLYPFFKSDIESGRFTREELSRFIAYFLMQFSAMGNYWGQPLYLGGSNPDGSTRVNELSCLILEIYDSLGIYNPKIQIKLSQSTPRNFVGKALEMIKSGSTSIVFCSEDIIIKSMMRSGASYEEACQAVVKGCYEYALRAGSIGISFNTFNALKPVVLVFNRGIDPTTGLKIGLDTGELGKISSFEDFYTAYLAQFGYIVDEGIKWIEALEKHIHSVNPTLMYSATIPRCVESLTDANDSGIKNVSDMLLNGLGSAVDALMAVYELVYETHTVTLETLADALSKNWEGYEILRQKALRCKHKYGVGDRVSDLYASAMHQFFASKFQGRKNGHGDNYEYELHSARAFIDMGKATEATPDGRRAGDETSKNASPTTGMDRNGVTALIRSATALDMSLSDSGACLDCMLHPSTVQGESGIDILYRVLMTYIDLGGASIHFNIFNSEMLRDAQENPEKYQNLQVRVCGWNVLWNNMSRSEQDAYIKRAEEITE